MGGICIYASNAETIGMLAESKAVWLMYTMVQLNIIVVKITIVHNRQLANLFSSIFYHLFERDYATQLTLAPTLPAAEAIVPADSAPLLLYAIVPKVSVGIDGIESLSKATWDVVSSCAVLKGLIF